MKELTVYYCGREQCKPGHSYGPASRPQYLIHIIINGRGRYHVAGNVYPLQKGDLFLIRPGDVTYYEADSQDPWEYAWFSFGGDSVDWILKRCRLFTRYTATPIETGKLISRITSLVDTYRTAGNNEFELLHCAYGLFSAITEKNILDEQMSVDDYTQQAVSFIHHNYSFDIKIQDIAEQIGIDRTYLYKLFVKKMKISPQQYLIRYRLHMGMKLLKETNMTVSEAALSCGFKDSQSFCHHFKKITLMTPGTYRHQTGDAYPALFPHRKS